MKRNKAVLTEPQKQWIKEEFEEIYTILFEGNE
jgi:hypothetical protein